MRKKAILLALITMAIFVIPIIGQIYVRRLKVNFFKQFFTEPFESLMIWMNDGTMYIYTENLEHTVRTNLSSDLKKDGYTIEDIWCIVHNHLTPKRFSLGDKRTYHLLKNRGFTGIFMIYYPHNNTLRWMR